MEYTGTTMVVGQTEAETAMDEGGKQVAEALYNDIIKITNPPETKEYPYKLVGNSDEHPAIVWYNKVILNQPENKTPA